jgi:hypothetical protein
LAIEVKTYHKAITLERQHKAQQTRYNPREKLGFWPRKASQPSSFQKSPKKKKKKIGKSQVSPLKGFSRLQSKSTITPTPWKHLFIRSMRNIGK